MAMTVTLAACWLGAATRYVDREAFVALQWSKTFHRYGQSSMNMLSRISASRLVIGAACLWMIPLVAESSDWVGELMDGSEIRVDADSHRAFRTDAGREARAWDGVHRLQDGTTVIVKDGIAVPTREMYSAWEEDAADAIDRPWCERLVEKSCGTSGTCSQSPGCERARALLATERSARREGGEDWLEALSACRQGLSDAAFSVCGAGSDLGVAQSCRALVQKVCGVDDACRGSQPCDAARQLLALELEERTARGGGMGQTQVGAQCQEALGNAFFAPCRDE